MPNWCQNTLFVEGDLNALQDFKKRVLKVNDNDIVEFTMNELMPTPPELLEQTSPAVWRGDKEDEKGRLEFENYLDSLEVKYGAKDWYEWRVNNWGTKWDVSSGNVDEMDGESLNIHYDTAWGPNDGFIKFASKVYPSLKFRLSYEEPGMGFCGVLICKDGEIDFEGQDDLQWVDEYDNIVEWDSELERWKRVSDNSVIDDEDFYPNEYNKFNF